MYSILITGCNRGLGLGLVKVLVNTSATSAQHIFAACRNPDSATELNQLKEQHKNLHVLKLDVNNYESYGDVIDYIDETVKENGLNVLFNNAGISPKSTRLPFVKSDDLINTYITNTVSPIMLTKAVLPLLKKATKTNSSKPFGVSRAAIINMSSILGSIASNVEGGLYAYRTAKCGLNAATKSMSIDLRDHKILCVSMHPGWVKTDMGGAKAPLDVEQSCKQMIDTLHKLNESHNGSFLQFNGSTLKW